MYSMEAWSLSNLPSQPLLTSFKPVNTGQGNPNEDLGMGQDSNTGNWTAGFSPCFHLPGQAILGALFDPRPPFRLPTVPLKSRSCQDEAMEDDNWGWVAAAWRADTEMVFDGEMACGVWLKI